MNTHIMDKTPHCTYFSLQEAKSGLYTDLYKGITSDPSNILHWPDDDGIDKVRLEKFAYIDDGTWLATYALDNCRVSLIKERFYKMGFGLAVPEGWPYKQYFDAV